MNSTLGDLQNIIVKTKFCKFYGFAFSTGCCGSWWYVLIPFAGLHTYDDVVGKGNTLDKAIANASEKLEMDDEHR